MSSAPLVSELVPPADLIVENAIGIDQGDKITDDFIKIGEGIIGNMRLAGYLKSDHNVLDVGCGLGRLARPLVGFLQGEYHGVDACRSSIDWCRENYSFVPNFHFHPVDVYSTTYNKTAGINASKYKFPFQDDYFDFQWSTSLFTHMLINEFENYIFEMARVIKPGAHCWNTFLLLDSFAEAAAAKLNDRSRWYLPVRVEGGRVRSVEDTALQVALDEERVLSLYRKAGLEVVEVRYGPWSGRTENVRAGGQDVVIARKAPVAKPSTSNLTPTTKTLAGGMLSSYAQELVMEADAAAEQGRKADAFEILRRIPFADFCELCIETPASTPHLAAIVPRLPSADVQKRWVGDHGRALMNRSGNLVRLFELMSWRHRGRSLEDARILDYGCGWGRLLRLLYHKTDLANIYGVDPMPESLRLCKECGVDIHLAPCDTAPSGLPFGATIFDFVFSFSVFTHVPFHIAQAILRCVRERIAKDGVFVVTVRSHEFWELRRPSWNSADVDALIQAHQKDGYAFIPLNASGLKSEDYGDTTYSRPRFEQLCAQCGWKVVDVERDMSEPFQIAMVLAPL